MDVFGSLNNEGTIQDNENGGHLIVNIHGHFDQSGSCLNQGIYLDGEIEQNISLIENSHFECSEFKIFGEDRIIYAMTSLFFDETEVDFQFKTLMLGNSCDLTLNGGLIENAHLEAGLNTITLNAGAWMDEMTVWDAVLDGNIMVGETVVFNGVTINNALMECIQGEGHYLEINGEFTNNDMVSYNIIDNAPLIVNISGDLINNGTWQPTTTNLTGSSDQYFSSNPFFEFYNTELNLNPVGGSLHLTSSFSFHNCDINLQGNSLLPTNTTNLDACKIHNGEIFANGSNLSLSNGSWFEDIVLNDIVLLGTTEVEDEVFSSGTMTIGYGAVLQHKEGDNRLLTINGNLVNLGEIRDSQYSYNLDMQINGDITNGGSWTTGEVIIPAEEDIEIQLDTPIAVREFMVLFDSPGELTFLSGINSEGTEFHFNQHTIHLGAESYSTVSGGLIEDATIQGAGNGLTLTDNAYIEYCQIHNLVLQGIFQVGEGNEFFESTEIAGVLQNRWPYNSSVTFYDDLVNNSTIRNNPDGYDLAILLHGDLQNNGSLTNYVLELTGNDPQHLSMSLGTPIEVEYFYGNGHELGIEADSDLYFYNSRVDLEHGSMVLSENQSIHISDKYLRNAAISCSGNVITMDNGAYLENAQLDSVILDGEVIFSSNCSVTTYLENRGILKGTSYGDITLPVEGNLVNSGSIQNGADWYWLYLEVTGDIANTGSITNHQLNMTGLDLQSLFLMDAIPINCQLNLYANAGTDDHQWYHNDLLMDFSYDYYGFNTAVLTFLVDIDTSWVGIYNCNTNQGWSRNISISAGPFGCTDSLAFNYDPAAIYDIGDCYGLSGDFNEDSAVDILDIVIMVDLVLFTEPDEYLLWIGDLNGDGALDILDIVTLVSIILGL